MSEIKKPIIFEEIPYTRPDAEAALQTIRSYHDAFNAADSAKAQLELLSRYDTALIEFYTMAEICYIRNSIDTTDAFYKAETDYFNEISPTLSAEEAAFMQDILKTPFRKELEDALGSFYFQKKDYAARSVDASIVSLMQEDNRLSTRYDEIYAGAQIPFQGRNRTVEEMQTFKADADRATRREAFAAEGRFFDENREELDSIYDQMVKNRTAQAKALGYDNYITLGNIRMGRYGYGAEEVCYFREQVVKYLVPLAAKIKDLQAKRSGITDFKAYDDRIVFADGNPVPVGTPKDILEKARTMYEALSPETAEFYNFLMDGHFLDVESKAGKAPGGYCAYLEAYKAPFIFSNFNQSIDDVEVITHEAGHAFEGYTAGRMPLSGTDREYSSETAECHSMAMEYLTGRFHHLFFKDERDTKKYELSHAESAITFIPYACIIDAFQYSVYENPDWTPEQRNQEWQRLLTLYQPYLTDYEDIPFYSRGAGWQFKLHVYTAPLYYIDYALAQLVALQFFLLDQEDHTKAWDTYMKLIRLAGTMRFADGVKACGLRSPFDEGVVKDVAERVYAWIEKNQIS